MNITTGLAGDLRLLTAALDEPGTDIAEGLQQLAFDARTAVGSYQGLSLSLSRSDPSYTCTYLDDGVLAGDIATSLRLTLPAPGASRVPSPVVLTLYAGSPGAFVDLAADLAWLTARPSSEFVLDRDLPIPAGVRTGTPLAAASVINEAIGVLIGRGDTPQQADRRLNSRAAAAGTDRYGAARLVLATLTAAGADPGVNVD